MSNEQLKYHCPAYIWISGALFTLFVSAFMSVVLLGGFLAGLSALTDGLFGLLPLRVNLTQPWYLMVLAVVLGGWLGGIMFWQTIATLLDLCTLSQVVTGKLESVELRIYKGTRSSRAWLLTVAGQTWKIEPFLFLKFPDLSNLKMDQPVRLQYRRGTRTVTHLWLGG